MGLWHLLDQLDPSAADRLRMSPLRLGIARLETFELSELSKLELDAQSDTLRCGPVVHCAAHVDEP